MKKILFLNLFVLFLASIGCQKEITPLDDSPDSLLQIHSFSPDSARVGDVVIIKGKGFDSAANGNAITINNIQQQVLQSSDTVLLIQITAATTTGRIGVRVKNEQAISSESLVIFSADQIQPLMISSFNPDTARIGDTIQIKGKGFDPAASGNIVQVHNTTAQVISANDSLLVIKVSDGSATGKISIAAKGQAATSSRELVILPGDSWTRKQDFPFTWTGDFMLNGNGFVKGFSSSTKGFFFKNNKLWQYDPVGNSWTAKADLPAGIKNFTFSFTIDTKAYIGLGAALPGDLMSMTKEVWEYDMTNNTWTRKNDFPGAGRVEPFSFSVNNFGYVGGGDATNANGSSLKDFWKYNPQTDSWNRVANFPGNHSVGVSGLNIGNKGFVLEAGQGNPTAPVSNFTAINLWSYDASLDMWSQKTSFPANGRTIISATMFSLGNKAFAAIGADDATDINGQLIKKDFWEYDVATDKWIERVDVGGPVRWFSSSFSIGNKGYVGLGNGNTISQNHTDFWQYTPE